MVAFNDQMHVYVRDQTRKLRRLWHGIHSESATPHLHTLSLSVHTPHRPCILLYAQMCVSVLPLLHRTSSSSHTNNPICNSFPPLSYSYCGLRYVHYFCLDAHFTASVFSPLTCGGSCTRKFNVVHGLRQRQRRTFSSQTCPWPWPGNLLCALPGWRVSLEESCWSKLSCILCKMKENLLLCYTLFFKTSSYAACGQLIVSLTTILHNLIKYKIEHRASFKKYKYIHNG